MLLTDGRYQSPDKIKNLLEFFLQRRAFSQKIILFPKMKQIENMFLNLPKHFLIGMQNLYNLQQQIIRLKMVHSFLIIYLVSVIQSPPIMHYLSH